MAKATRRRRPAWDEVRATKLCEAAVFRKRGLFASQFVHSDDDLIQECLMRARREWRKWRAGKGMSPWSWISQSANNQLIEMARVIHRRRENDHRVRADMQDSADDGALLANSNEPETLIDRLGNLCRRARALSRLREQKTKRGRGRAPTYDIGQTLVMLALMEWKKLSIRGLQFFLESNGEICRTIQLQTIPSSAQIGRLKKSVSQIGRLSAAFVN